MRTPEQIRQEYQAWLTYGKASSDEAIANVCSNQYQQDDWTEETVRAFVRPPSTPPAAPIAEPVPVTTTALVEEPGVPTPRSEERGEAWTQFLQDVADLFPADNVCSVPASTATPLDGALMMVSRGLPQIFLAPRGKNPWKGETWEDKIMTSADAIRAGALSHPDSNFGTIALAKPEGFWFLEIDSLNVVERIKVETGNDMFALGLFSVRSSPGRGHFYFRHSAASIAMGNIAQGFVKGADWSARCNMQYVASVGSIHPRSGNPYEILTDAPIQEAPQWLIDWCLTQKVTKERIATTKIDGPTEATFERREFKSIEVTPEGPKIPYGGHDTTLTSIAGKLHHDNPDLSEHELASRLIAICEARCVNYGADYKEMCEKIAHSIGKKPVTVDEFAQQIAIRADLAKAQHAQAGAQVLAELPKDAIGMTAEQIPIYPYPKECDEADEDLTAEELENRSFLNVEYPEPAGTDLVSLFSHELCTGTTLPYGFIRESLKNMTNMLIDRYYIHPQYPTLSLRGFHFNIGPGFCGKTVSFDKVVGWMKPSFDKRHIAIRDLIGYGSQQYFIKSLSWHPPEMEGSSEKPKKKDFQGNPNQFLHVKEGQKLASNTTNEWFRGVFANLTDLYDQTHLETGSMGRGQYEADNVHVSCVVCITPSDFKSAFSGKGTIGGGALQRWTIVCPPIIPNTMDWCPLAPDLLGKTVHRIQERLPKCEDAIGDIPPKILSGPQYLTEEPGAKEIRLKVQQELAKAGEKGKRLIEYFIREQVNQAVFSIRNPLVMTTADAEYVAEWVDAQLSARLYWPVDAGQNVERNEVLIRRAVSRHFVTERELQNACNYWRPGSGGAWAFDTALRNMLKRDIKFVGVAGQRKTRVYCPRWCKEHPAILVRP